MSTLAIVVSALPLLVTFSGNGYDLLAARSRIRALERLARDARSYWDGKPNCVRSGPALLRARVAYRAQSDADHIVVDLEQHIPTRFMWVAGLRAIPLRASARRPAPAAWEWRYPGDTWERIIRSSQVRPGTCGGR